MFAFSLGVRLNREGLRNLAQYLTEFATVLYFVFPNADHDHSVGSEFAIDQRGTADVAIYLAAPIRPIAAR